MNVSFEIKISVYTKGTYKIKECCVNNNEIVVTKFFTNGELPVVTYRKVLESEEEEKFISIISILPLKDFKKKYVNESVEGEQSIYFEIKKADFYKKIYLYFDYPPELLKLTEEVNSLLPDFQQIYLPN
jgi:hypothetical protein